MKKIHSPSLWFLSLFAVLASTPTFSQGSHLKSSEPDIQIDVNRELDENGNVIRYDSTYSWSYTSNGGDNFDSILKEMGFSTRHAPTHFKHSSIFQDDPFFNDPAFGFQNLGAGFEDMMKMHHEMMQMHEEMMRSFGGGMQPDVMIPTPQQQPLQPAPPGQPAQPLQPRPAPKPHDPNNPVIDL